jgi:hypothetical protein
VTRTPRCFLGGDASGMAAAFSFAGSPASCDFGFRQLPLGWLVVVSPFESFPLESEPL